jgi:hypothetical protein
MAHGYFTRTAYQFLLVSVIIAVIFAFQVFGWTNNWILPGAFDPVKVPGIAACSLLSHSWRCCRMDRCIPLQEKNTETILTRPYVLPTFKKIRCACLVALTHNVALP